VLGITAESNFQLTFGLIVDTRELSGFHYVKILWVYDTEMKDVDYEMSWAKESEVSLFKKKSGGIMNNEMQIRINPDDLLDVKCEGCENLYFEQVLQIKKLSALQSPNGKESLIPVPVFRCTSCGEVIKDLNN